MLQTIIRESTHQNSLLQGSHVVEQVIPVVIAAAEPDRTSYCDFFLAERKSTQARGGLPLPHSRSAPFSCLQSTQKYCILSLKGANSPKLAILSGSQISLMTAYLIYFPYFFYLFIISKSAFPLKIV